jgi:hypothetical protein
MFVLPIAKNKPKEKTKTRVFWFFFRLVSLVQRANDLHFKSPFRRLPIAT